MPLSDKTSQLNSDEHKNKTKQQLGWCEDCGKYISDKTRHFQSKIHLQKNQQSKFVKICITPGMRSTSGVKITVNEKTYIYI